MIEHIVDYFDYINIINDTNISKPEKIKLLKEMRTEHFDKIQQFFDNLKLDNQRGLLVKIIEYDDDKPGHPEYKLIKYQDDIEYLILDEIKLYGPGVGSDIQIYKKSNENFYTVEKNQGIGDAYSEYHILPIDKFQYEYLYNHSIYDKIDFWNQYSEKI